MTEIRVDAMTILTITFTAIIGIGTLKILALKYHEHPVAQGFNVLF